MNASGSMSYVMGENHSSSPASSAYRPAAMSRSGSSPDTRIAVAWRSDAIARMSRRTSSSTKVGLVLRPSTVSPVS